MDTPWVLGNSRPIAGPAQVREILELAARTPHPPGAALGSAIADALEILPLAVIEQGGTGGRDVLGFEHGLSFDRQRMAGQDREADSAPRSPAGRSQIIRPIDHAKAYERAC